MAKTNCVDAAIQCIAKFHVLPGRAHKFSLGEWNFKEKLPFVQVNYRSIRCEISCKLLSKLSSKNHGNKEQNSRISLALLLHNTVLYYTHTHYTYTYRHTSLSCLLHCKQFFLIYLQQRYRIAHYCTLYLPHFILWGDILFYWVGWNCFKLANHFNFGA